MYGTAQDKRRTLSIAEKATAWSEDAETERSSVDADAERHKSTDVKARAERARSYMIRFQTARCAVLKRSAAVSNR